MMAARPLGLFHRPLTCEKQSVTQSSQNTTQVLLSPLLYLLGQHLSSPFLHTVFSSQFPPTTPFTLPFFPVFSIPHLPSLSLTSLFLRES